MYDENGREHEYLEGDVEEEQAPPEPSPEELEPMDLGEEDDDPHRAFFAHLKSIASPRGIPLLCATKEDILMECTDAASPAFVMLYGLYFVHGRSDVIEQERLKDWLYVARLAEAHTTKLESQEETLEAIKKKCSDYVQSNADATPFIIVVQNKCGAMHAWASGYPYHSAFQLFHALCERIDKTAHECGLTVERVHEKLAQLYSAMKALLPGELWGDELDAVRSAFDTVVKQMDEETNHP